MHEEASGTSCKVDSTVCSNRGTYLSFMALSVAARVTRLYTGAPMGHFVAVESPLVSHNGIVDHAHAQSCQ